MSDLMIGIDLGGTNIAAIAWLGDGTIAGRGKDKTPPGADLKTVAETMHVVAGKALKKAGADWADVARVGIAVPSSIDPDTGELLHAPNLGWRDEPALPTLRAIFETEVFLENDVNCGTLGEFKCGAAQGARSVVGFFVGTGLGGGVIVNGHLHTGLRGVAGEVGHQIVRYKGRRCGCGHRGCLEAYCSKVAFGKQFRKLIVKKGQKSALTAEVGQELANVKSKILAATYRDGDPVVRRVLNEGAYMLGVASANAMTVIAPDCLVYGGGVMEALGSELLPKIQEGMNDHLFGLHPSDVTLKLSALGDDAVPVGAAFLAQQKGRV